MRVLFKDENGNLAMLEANGLGKGSNKQPVVSNYSKDWFSTNDM